MRIQDAHLSQKYSFNLLKSYGVGIKKYKVLSTYPCSTVSIVDEHLKLPGMNLTSSRTFKETRMTVVQFFADFKRKKNSAMVVKNLVQLLKCENSKKQGQPSLVIIINTLSWYGKSLYGHLDFFVRFRKYYFNLPQTKRNPVLLSLTVKMSSY